MQRKYGSTMPQYMRARGKAPVTPASVPAIIHPSGPAVVQVRIRVIRATGHSTAASSSITTLEASGMPCWETCTTRLTTWCQAEG